MGKKFAAAGMDEQVQRLIGMARVSVLKLTSKPRVTAGDGHCYLSMFGRRDGEMVRW
jgi:hypothetical protein